MNLENIEYLVVNGCSFSYGACMYVEDPKLQTNEITSLMYENRFSRKLAEKLNCEDINLSQAGGSNDRMFRTTFDWCMRNHDKVKKSLFVFGLTSLSRVDLFSKQRKQHYPFLPQVQNPEAVAAQLDYIGCSAKEYHQWIEFHFKYLYDNRVASNTLRRNCVLFQNYLPNVIFFDALGHGLTKAYSMGINYFTFSDTPEGESWQSFMKIEGHPNQEQHHIIADLLYEHITQINH